MRGHLVRIVLLTSIIASPSYASYIPSPPGSTVGSWDWGIGFSGGAWDFDQMVWVYRPDLDTGGGRFQSPYFDNFTYTTFGTGPTAVGWGPVSANPNVGDIQGPSLDFGPTLWMRYYLDGDASKRTGFSIGFYEGGSFSRAIELEVGEDFDVFQGANITEQEFNDHRTAVPEPTTLFALLGVGAIGFIRRRLRR